MSIFGLWYYHTPEGQQFLEARAIRILLAATGILAGYVLLRTRKRFLHQESWKRTAARLVIAGIIAAMLWLGVDWVRGENWIFRLLVELPRSSELEFKYYEDEIKYMLLIVAGWIGWTEAIFEGLRWIAIVRRRRPAALKTNSLLEHN